MAKTALFILAVFLALASRAETAPLFACSGEDPDVSCDDRELVALDKAVDVRFNTLVAKVDPLTALLLRRDQRWFAEILDDSQLFPEERSRTRTEKEPACRSAQSARCHRAGLGRRDA